MPNSTVICTHCQTRLRLPPVVETPAIQCPRCQHVFSLPRPNEDNDATIAMDGLSIPELLPKPQPEPILPPPLPPPPPPIPPRSSSRNQPPPIPRPRAVHTESVAFDRMDEDDFLPPPRRRPRDTRSSGRPFMIIGAILGTLIALVVILILLLSGNSGNRQRELLAWVPAESNVMMGIDIHDGLSQPRINQFVNDLINQLGRREADEFFREAGFELNDLDLLWMAGKFPTDPTLKEIDFDRQASFCILVKLRSPKFNVERLRREFDAAEIAVGNKQIYRGYGDMYFHFPTNDLMILSNRESELARLITKKEGEIAVFGSMRTEAERAMNHQLWVAVSDAKVFSASLRDPVFPEVMRDAPDWVLRLWKSIQNGTGYTATCGMKGESISLDVTLTCDSSKSAGEIVTELQGQLRQAENQLRREFRGEPIRKLIERIQIRSSSEIVQLSFRIELADLRKIFEEITGIRADDLFNPRGLNFGGDNRIR